MIDTTSNVDIVQEQAVAHKAYKTALLPTPLQAQQMMKFIAAARFVYNAALEQRIHLYERSRQWQEKPIRVSEYDQSKELTAALAMPEFAWLKECPRKALNASIENLERAYAAFFKRVKKGGVPAGFPRYKSRYRGSQGFRFTDPVSIKNGAINLPKVGWVKLAESDYLPEGMSQKIASGAVTISRIYPYRKDYDAATELDVATLINNGAKFMVSVTVAEPKPEPEPFAREVVAVHLGLRYWAVTSEGERFEPPKALFEVEDKMRLLQRRLSRREKGSGRRERVRAELARLHEHVANIRVDALHKMTTWLTGLRPRVLVVERWEIDKMMKDPVFARRIGNAAWGMFWQQAAYKMERVGTTVIATPENFKSSRRCSTCGHINSRPPNGAIFICEASGHRKEREANSVDNLLWYAETGIFEEV